MDLVVGCTHKRILFKSMLFLKFPFMSPTVRKVEFISIIFCTQIYDQINSFVAEATTAKTAGQVLAGFIGRTGETLAHENSWGIRSRPSYRAGVDVERE